MTYPLKFTKNLSLVHNHVGYVLCYLINADAAIFD